MTHIAFAAFPPFREPAARRDPGERRRRAALTRWWSLAVAALSALTALTVVPAGAKSSGLSVTTTAGVAGALVQGSILVSNATTKAVSLTNVRARLEVRYASGAQPPALPAGSDAGTFLVASSFPPRPASVPAGGSVTVAYSFDACSPAVASYAGAKDMRTVAVVTAGGAVLSARSANFIPPPQRACPVCGNGIPEAGEQCDGGGCCSSACRWAATGAACSDGNACTRGDACLAGQCLGGAAVSCPASDQCHDAGTCNPANGTCSNPARPNGTRCDDASACTTGDACAAGRCAGAPLRCDDSNVCTSDQCAGGECVHLATALPCEDGSPCTDGDTCAAGACLGGMPRDCSDHQSCTEDACDDVDACVHAAAPVCDACDSDECGVCQALCVVDQGACSDGCWAGFGSCLDGCTSTYCAPFCQVDLGRCLDACPDQATCLSDCEAGNGCALGCTPTP